MRDSSRPRDETDGDQPRRGVGPAADPNPVDVDADADPANDAVPEERRGVSDGPRVDPGGDADGSERPPLEPGSPSTENTLFVLLGVALTILLILSTLVPSPL